MKINLNKYDIIMMQTIIIMLAFKDYTVISIISQIIAFFGLVMFNLFKEKKINRNAFQYCLYKLFFIAFCLCSIMWAVKPENVTKICTTLMVKMMTGITIITYVKNEENRNKFLKFMVFAGAILCIRMIFTVPLKAWGTERVGNYLSHNVDNSYGNTGITYVLGILGIYLLSDQKCIKNKSIRYILMIIFSLFSLLSGSKKQIILLIISIVIYALLKSKNTMKTFLYVIRATIAIFIMLFAVFKIDLLYNSVGVRIESALYYTDSGTKAQADASTITRAYFIKEAKRVIREKTILGVGIDCFKNVNVYQKTWAENNYLELLADVGVIGFAIYYSIYIKIIICLMRRLKQKNSEDIQDFIIFISLLLIDATMVSYFNSTLQFHFAFLYASLMCRNPEKTNKNMKEEKIYE